MNSPKRPHVFGNLTAAFVASVAITGAGAAPADTDKAIAGPIQLSAGAARAPAAGDDHNGRSAIAVPQSDEWPHLEIPKPAQPSEFETYVSGLAGANVRRLGAELMLPNRNTLLVESNRQVPPDYVVGFGDEIQLTTWGAVDADLRLTVDRAGRIVVPRVGPVVVAGVRHGDLNELLTRRVSQVFKNFQLSATLGRLRSIRFYVTGFVAKPGAYSISSLGTVMAGLVQSGGPSAGGSVRNIELRRNGQTIAHFDLYDLLVRGDKKGDLPLQADDVLHVGPIGPQLALVGSFNKPAVVELKPTDTVNDAIAYVGGFSAVADTQRIAIERLSERNDRRVTELALPRDGGQKVGNGDVLRAFNSVSAALPQAKQYKTVRVEGEVAHPGDYVLRPASTLMDAIQAAGGLTAQAFLYGTDFSRASVRRVQEAQYERALRDLETDFARNASSRKVGSADDALATSQSQANTSRLIERLRAVKPTGRVVLELTAASQELPALSVEDGDRIYIPARPTTVGVFGSVFNGGSYLYTPGVSIDDVLKLAGGPTRGADKDSIFVIRANGSVTSARGINSGWLNLGSSIANLPALPGDTVFVPEEMNKTTFMQEARDWTQILYQFGLGAAALKTIKN